MSCTCTLLMYNGGMPNKIVFSQEMIDDLYKMGDRDYCKKWNITNPTIRKFRRANGIKPFTNQCGTKPHKLEDGKEYKWCYKGHWELINNFFSNPKNYDGIARICKTHAMENHKKWIIDKRGEDWKPKFNGIEHKFIEDIEHKWCPIGKHWVPIAQFHKSSERRDGVAGICIQHAKEAAQAYHATEKSRQVIKAWKQTPTGKESQRRLWRRKATEKKQLPYSWDPEDEHFAYDIFEHRCAYCGNEIGFLTLEFDHFVPRASKGATVPENMVPCCKECNHGIGGKFEREVMEWLTGKFGEKRAIFIYRDIKNKLKLVRKVEYEQVSLLPS